MIYTKTYSNGLTLLAKPMPYLKSCTFNLRIPSGVAFENPSRRGVSSFTCEMALRGCGRWNSRQFIEQLRSRGASWDENIGIANTTFLASFPSIYLHDILEIYAALAQNAHFDESFLESSRQRMILERIGIEDAPTLVARLAAEKEFFPIPWNENSYGDLDVLYSVTLDELKTFYQTYYRPDGTILAVAGAFDWNELQDEVESLFSSWRTQGTLKIEETPPTRQNQHIDFDSQQTQIVVAFDGVPYQQPDYYCQWAGAYILGRDGSGRLFTQLRERQGLCYWVDAYSSVIVNGSGIFCRLGTNSDHSELALDCLLKEIQRLFKYGITEDELGWLKTNVRADIIMSQESSDIQAAHLVSDWFLMRRCKTIEEQLSTIDKLTVDTVNDFLLKNAPQKFLITTLGKRS